MEVTILVTPKGNIHNNPILSFRGLPVDDKDEFIYGFEWEPNCLALWSNYSVLHNPVNDFNAHRVMHRITIQ